MKRNFYTQYVIMGLALLIFSITSCGKKDDSQHIEIAQQLVAMLNKQLPGSEFKTNLEKCLVKPTNDKRYWVSLKDSTFTTDLTWLVGLLQKEIAPQATSFASTNPAQIEEMVLLYGPEENYTELKSIKGIKIDADFAALKAQDKPVRFRDFEPKTVQASVEHIIFDNWNIKDLLKNQKKTFPKAGGITFKHIKIDASGQNVKGENIAVSIDIEKINNVEKGLEDRNLQNYLFKKDAPPPNLAETLQKGLALTDFNVETGKVEVSIKENGVEVYGGSLAGMTYSQFVKPDRTHSFFNAGYGVGLDHLKLSFPDKKEFELLGDIKQLQFRFAVEKVSPEAVLVFMNLIKKSIELRDEADNPNMPDVMIQTMTLISEIAKSESHAKFSVSPFVHSLGEMQGEATIQLKPSIMLWPEMKITVDIFKIDEIIKNIRATGLLAETRLESFIKSINQLTIKKENGDASLMLKTKADQPGTLFLNGKPMLMDIFKK